MAYVDKDLAAYLATLQVGDEVHVSSYSTVHKRTITRMTKTLFIMKNEGTGYERRFRRDNGLDFDGGTASWRRDCIITPQSAESRVAARQREIRVSRLRSIMDGLGLDQQNRTKAQVLEALDKARALAEELL